MFINRIENDEHDDLLLSPSCPCGPGCMDWFMNSCNASESECSYCYKFQSWLRQEGLE
jgi:hypothetical protein